MFVLMTLVRPACYHTIMLLWSGPDAAVGTGAVIAAAIKTRIFAMKAQFIGLRVVLVYTIQEAYACSKDPVSYLCTANMEMYHPLTDEICFERYLEAAMPRPEHEP